MKVVPSQVVQLIDRKLPETLTAGVVQGVKRLHLGNHHAPTFVAIVELAERIPPELITLSGADYENLVVGLAGLRFYVDVWRQGKTDVSGFIPGTGLKHPVQLVRAALALCHDEAPAEGTIELPFVTDTALRASIRLDISTAESALRNREWKAATVLAGAVTEALLLWAIEQKGDVVWKAAKAYPGRPIERWDLDHYIAVALELQIITADTAAASALARKFRNLIHPGRASRLGVVCDRGTAMSALAAVEHVVRDLTRWKPPGPKRRTKKTISLPAQSGSE